MSSSVLNLKPEEVDSFEKRGKYTISIMGCGQIGVFHAYLFAEAGFKVICVDADQTIVNHLARGKAPFLKHEIELKLGNHVKTGRLNATNDVKRAVSQSDVVAITIPVKVDEKKKADYSDIENTCKLVGSSLLRGSLVIVVSIMGIGVTEGLVNEILENTSGFKVGVDFGLVYSPIRTLDGETLERFPDHKRIVAARNKNSSNSASAILGTIAKKGIIETENVKAAEAAALFEMLQQDINVALANELALFCEKAGADYLKARKLLDTDAYCALSLPTLAGGSIKGEPYLLLEEAENLGVRLRISTIAIEINEEIVRHVVNLARDALRNCGKTLRRAKISLLGLSQMPNTKSSIKKAVKALAKMLEAKGAKVSVYDPYFPDNELTEIPRLFKKSLVEVLEGVDCIILLTGHEQFKRLSLKKLKVMMKMPAAIVDLEGIVEPDKVEREGFVYRGLGRGVWTK